MADSFAILVAPCSQAEAEAGTNNDKPMTSLRTKQAIGEQSVLRVADRTALLASTSDAAYFVDSTGVNEFKVSADQVSDADNVLRIERTDGSIVERIWDGVNFFAEWVPLGVPVWAWGIPVTTGDKLTAALGELSANQVLHLQSGAEYLLSYPAQIFAAVKINGNGATIKRENQRSSLLTANASVGATSVTVADGAAFRVGQRCFVVKNAGVLGGHAHVDNSTTFAGFSGAIITSIVGNVVTFAVPLVRSVVIGEKLVALDNMIIQQSGGLVQIDNVVFDGNLTQHSDIVDWAAGNTLVVKKGLITNCVFQNIPNECVAMGTGEVRGCEWNNCRGSAIHISNALVADADGMLIQNMIARDVATLDNGHSEGVITFSAASQRVRVKDAYFENTTTKGIGVLGLMDAGIPTDHDDYFYAENVVAKNFSRILLASLVAGTVNLQKIDFVHCMFHTCGPLTLGGGGNIAEGPYIRKVSIDHCHFINSWIAAANIRDLSWTQSHLYWDVGSAGVYAGCSPSNTFATLPTTRIGGTALVSGDFSGLLVADGGNPQGVYVWSGSAWVHSPTETSKLPPVGVAAGLQCYDCNLNMTGGSVMAPAYPGRQGEFVCGIWLQQSVAQKTEAGTSTFAYAQVRISDVDVVGWVTGIGYAGEANWSSTPNYDALGWSFTDVRVYPIRSNIWTNVTGIEVVAGCTADNCTVHMPDTADQTATCGIILKGPIDPTKTIGGVAKNCSVPFMPAIAGTMYGSAIRLGTVAGGSGAVQKNCVAINNLIAKAVDQTTANDKIVSGNIIVDATALPGYTAPTAIPFRAIGANENLY